MNGRVDMKINDVLNFIDDLDGDDLQKVINVVKMRRDQLHFQNAQSLRVGDAVSFTGRRGSILKGVVEKVKVKYILVRTTLGQRWNVPGSHLTKIKEKVSA